MMKRSPIGSVYDIPAPVTEQKIPTPSTPGSGETKVVWHSDLTGLVGPREEEVRRKSPEMKFLYIVSACLTIMVLWGIFREVHVLVPNMFDSPGGDAQQNLSTLDRIQTNTLAFQVDTVGIDGRKEAKHFVEVPVEQFLGEKPRKLGHKQTDLPSRGDRKTLPLQV